MTDRCLDPYRGVDLRRRAIEWGYLGERCLGYLGQGCEERREHLRSDAQSASLHLTASVVVPVAQEQQVLGPVCHLGSELGVPRYHRRFECFPRESRFRRR